MQTLGKRELPGQAVDNMIRLLNDELVTSGTICRMTDTDRTRADDTFMVVGAVVGSLARRRGRRTIDRWPSERARWSPRR